MPLSPAPTRDSISGGGLTGQKPVTFSGTWSSWFSGLTQYINNVIQGNTVVLKNTSKPAPVTDGVVLYVTAVGVSPARVISLIALGPNNVDHVIHTWTV